MTFDDRAVQFLAHLDTVPFERAGCDSKIEEIVVFDIQPKTEVKAIEAELRVQLVGKTVAECWAYIQERTP
jgi:hypothetical protein